MHESNFTANVELDDVLSLYLFNDQIKGGLIIFCLTYIIIMSVIMLYFKIFWLETDLFPSNSRELPVIPGNYQYFPPSWEI